MKESFLKHRINEHSTVKEALEKLDLLASESVLFVVNQDQKVLGTITDGDLRRGFIKGLSLTHPLNDFMKSSFRFIRKGETSLNDISNFRKLNIKILPEINQQGLLIGVVNLEKQKSFLPLDAIIMAGGRGERLRPLTDTLPKPLLKVGEKPILEHNIDRLKDFGVKDFWITLNYLGEKIENFFNDGSSKEIRINYIKEQSFLGTIGAVSLVENLVHDVVLVMNSDLLTSIDYEDFYQTFIDSNASMAVASIPYKLNIPYAVLEIENGQISSFKEKPTYTYQSNAGIYLIKKEVLDFIPNQTYFNATDLIEKLIKNGQKVVHYPILSYWLDIGKHEDFQKAQEDIEHLNL